MGVVPNEPSMEDILSSIKRIIADGSDRTPSQRTPRRRAASQDERGPEGDSPMDIAEQRTDADDQETEAAILELTDMVEEAAAPSRPQASDGDATSTPGASNDAKPAPIGEQILSDVSAQAARQSLSQLSSLLVRPQEGEANTLEGLVREMLRPMLKDWLEAKLPELVESLVKKEIDRIVGRLG